jgi:OmpA-OmpF porin, OOP family
MDIAIAAPQASRSSSGGTPAARSACRAIAAVVVGLALTSSARSARAQTIKGFSDDRFEPAAAGSEWLSAESLEFSGHLRAAGRFDADWAWKPLVVYDLQGHEAAALVRQQMVAHLGAAVTLWDRARVDLGLLFAPLASGSASLVNGHDYPAPSGASVGDLRLGADVRVFGSARSKIRGAAGAQLFVPTGATNQFMSDGGLRFWPRFMVAGEAGAFTWAGRLGLHLRPGRDCACDLRPGDELTGGLAVGWRMSPDVLVGPELNAASPISGGRFGRAVASPIEILAGARIAVVPGWHVSVGLGTGLTEGPGAPTLRGLLGLQYQREPDSFASRVWAPPP